MSPPPPEAVVTLCRAAIFAALLMLWGAALFRTRLSPEASRRHEASWLMALITATTMLLPAQTALLAGYWREALRLESIWIIIDATSPGRSWLVLATLATFMTVAWCHRNDNGIMVAGLGIMAGLSMTGHAAASDGMPGLLRQANDILHMASAAAWLGALPHVLGLLPRLHEPGARETLMRYSGEGHFWVSMVMLTGLISTLWIFGGIPLDASGRYTQLWWLKVLLVMGMSAAGSSR